MPSENSKDRDEWKQLDRLTLERQLDRFKLLLAQRGLKFPFGIYLARITLGKRDLMTANSYLGEVIFWSLILALVGASAPTILLASLIILLCRTFGTPLIWLGKQLTKLISKIRSSTQERPMTALAAHTMSEEANRNRWGCLAAYFIAFGLIFDPLTVWFSLFLVSNFTRIDVLQTSSLYVSSLASSAEFDSTIFYLTSLIVFAIILVLTILRILLLQKSIKSKLSAATLTSFVVQSVGLFVIGWLLFNAGLELGTLFILLSLNYIVSQLYFILAVLYSLSVAMVQILASLIRIEASVLGITLLAAIIPFLNADAWQLLGDISWNDMAWIAALVYVGPILFLIYFRKDVIKSVVYDKFEEKSRELDLDVLLSTYRRHIQDAFDMDLQRYICRGYKNLSQTKYWTKTIITKNVVKFVLLLGVIPVCVALFSIVLSHFMLERHVLDEWTDRYFTPKSLSVTWFSIDGWMVLRVKAAVLLGVLSSALTLGALVRNKEDFSEFLQNVFLNEMIIDDQVLRLYRAFEHGSRSSHAQVTEDTEVTT